MQPPNALNNQPNFTAIYAKFDRKSLLAGLSSKYFPNPELPELLSEANQWRNVITGKKINKDVFNSLYRDPDAKAFKVSCRYGYIQAKDKLGWVIGKIHGLRIILTGEHAKAVEGLKPRAKMNEFMYKFLKHQPSTFEFLHPQVNACPVEVIDILI